MPILRKNSSNDGLLIELQQGVIGVVPRSILMQEGVTSAFETRQLIPHYT